ncbi:MAG: hypothetical protein ACOY4R_29225 [Pseudomonadota bacterium]
MAINRDYSGISELERELELELEMDDELEIDDEAGAGNDSYEAETDEEADLQGNFESEGDLYADELKVGRERPFEVDEGSDQEFVERFMEVASREFEAEFELDQAMNEVLDDVAQEYLFGRILRGARSLGRRVMKNKALGALVRKGLRVASGHLPALKAAMQLAQGNLQSALLNVGKQMVGTAIPGGSVALGALSALGGSGAPAEREVWENYTQMAREAFEHLADTVNEAADQPVEASRLAANAFQHAVRRAQARAGAGRLGQPGAAGGAVRGRGGARRVHLRPGEKLIISGAGTIIVRGG